MKTRSKSKKVDKKIVKKRNILLTVLLVLLIAIISGLIYINPFVKINNKKLVNNIQEVLTKETVTLEELIPFSFDSVYVYQPYTKKSDMEKEIGIKSRFIKDNYSDTNGTEIIVIKDNRVIASIFMDLDKDGYIIEPLVYSNKLDYNDNVEFVIERYETGTFIRQVIHEYDDTFNNISYNLPGAWWKEDWEDDGYLYIIDDESGDHFIIRKYDELSLSKFKDIMSNEGYKLDKEKKYIVNNYEGYYVSGVKDETSKSLHYVMLTIGDDVYTFKMDYTPCRCTEPYDNFVKVLNSIKEI